MTEIGKSQSVADAPYQPPVHPQGQDYSHHEVQASVNALVGQVLQPTIIINANDNQPSPLVISPQIAQSFVAKKEEKLKKVNSIGAKLIMKQNNNNDNNI